MTDTVVPESTAKDTVSSTEDTVVNGDVVTTTTKTKTLNSDNSVTTTTTIDKTDHANGDNHMTTLSQSTTSDDSDLDKKIVRQVEYYFGDVNMVRDKFLKAEVVKEDGWIPLSILTTFKRLQALTIDPKAIFNALKKSVSGLLELNETEGKIRRHPERSVPSSQAELEVALRNRTIYVKGFPKTADVTLDKLLVFFERFGSTDNIQMQRQFKTKDFNGAAFVVFPTEEEARAFVAKSKETPIKYEDGSVLECSLQDDHYKKKALDMATGGKGGAMELREKRANEKQARKEKHKDDLEKKTSEHAEKLNSETLHGALIHLAGMPANGTRELIKAKFTPFTKMPWVDFNKGDAEAWVRLNEANTAKGVLEKVLAADNGKLVIGSTEVTPRILEGEEEANFLKEANEKRAAHRTQKGDRFGGGKRGRGRGGRDNRGGRGGRNFQKRKRNAGDDDDSDDDGEPPSKGSTSTEPKKLKGDSSD